MRLPILFRYTKSTINMKLFLLPLLTVLTLPLGLTFAQDFEAVEKRLAKGVVKGELSLQQAAAMMEMLHEICGRR